MDIPIWHYGKISFPVNMKLIKDDWHEMANWQGERLILAKQKYFIRDPKSAFNILESTYKGYVWVSVKLLWQVSYD